jgi:WD40 repeat protein
MSSSTASPSPIPAPSIHPPAVQRVFDDRPFRADGELLALGFGDDGTLWTVEDPGLLRRWDLDGQRALAWHLLSELENLWTFSRDASVLASASDELSLWDVPTGQLQAVLPQASWVTALALRADAGLVATGHEDGSVCLWDAANDEQLHDRRGHRGPVSALAFSPDGTRLASAGEDRIIRIWDVATGKECVRLEGHKDRIPALVWHPQGHRLYSAGWDTSVWVWDVGMAAPVILLNSHASQVQAVAITRDGTRLACADSGQAIHLWDLATHRPVRVFRGFEGEARCLAFRGDGQILASGGNDRIVHLWNPNDPVGQASPADAGTASGRATMRSMPYEPRTRLALSADGTRLASLGLGQGVRLWDVATQQKVMELDEVSGLNALASSAEGRWIAAGGADTAIHLWDATTGRRQATLEGAALPVTALAFAPHAPLLASASAIGCDVWLWNAERGTPALILPDAIDGCSIEALAFSAQGDLLAVGGIDWLATGGSDGAVHVWDVVNRVRRLSLSGGARSLAFHPEGKQLAAASLMRTIRVWDVCSGRLLRELSGHDDAINCIAYSPDGHRFASAADDYTVRLWDAQTGAVLGVTELDTQVKVLCFSPDGRSLFTGNGNSSCYQLKTQRLLNDER